MLRGFYRPFIYSHHINDFHFADTLGNSLGTVAAVYATMALLGRDKDHERRLIHTVSLSLLRFQVAHPLLGKPADPWDMIATVVASALCFALYRLLHGQVKAGA